MVFLCIVPTVSYIIYLIILFIELEMRDCNHRII